MITSYNHHHNIIISHTDGGTALSERGRKTGAVLPNLLETDLVDNNLYFNPSDTHWMDEHLLRMQAAGKEKASLFGDPLFTDPSSGDFSFRPGSPALALGIEPLDVSKMGRREMGATR